MNNKEWLLSLEENNYNEIEKCLEKLKNPEKNYLRIHIVGSYGKKEVETFIRDAIAENHIGVIDFKQKNINEMISYDNRFIEEDDILFHAGCIRKITEENDIHVSFTEAIFLMGLNLFREKKQFLVILKNEAAVTNGISYDLTICTDHNYTIKGKTIAICEEKKDNLISISRKNIFVYKCEMCSFNYENCDYDINMIGYYNAYLAVLAIRGIQELFPNVKKGKLKKRINDTICEGYMERVNINPRIILHTIEEESIENVESIIKEIYTNKNVKMLSQEEFKSIEQIKEEIKSAQNNDVLVIVGDACFIKETRKIFKVSLL